MTEKNLEKLKTLENWETENQGLIKDGWKVVQVLKETSKPYQKYAIIECIHCGETRLVMYYNFLNHKTTPCTKCGGIWIDWANDMIGKTVGHYKILDYVGLIKRTSNNKVDIFFKVQCIHCGNIREKELYSNSGWNRYPQCPQCPRIKDDYYTKRYKEYIKSAKDRNKEWNLTLEEFIKIGSGDCFYCGQKAPYQSRTIWTNSEVSNYFNGIDRIDSSKGYTYDNCVSCCSHCNVMKMQYTQSEFLSKISKIYNYSIIKQGQTTIENTSNDGSEQSTLQANGDGNGGYPTSNIEDNEIV